MKRIASTFAELKANDKKALIPFITSGDPVAEGDVDTVSIMHALVAGGANLIELGIPFSDPAADGEAIQHASERAIKNGTNYSHILDYLTKFRKTDDKTPVILMGYLNSAETYEGGFQGFCKAANKSGADGVILVDLSYESGKDYRKVLQDNNIDLVNLIAPTTSTKRIGLITKAASGFVYYVSMRGITGAGKGLNTAEIEKSIQTIREKTELPVCVGFGINDGETAKTIANFADGVVVGSALVKKLYNASQNKENILVVAEGFMKELRAALDS